MALTSKSNRIDAIAAVSSALLAALNRATGRRTVLSEQILALTAATAQDGGLGRMNGLIRFFVRDHPRKRWCSAACGNRARVARHYRRHHSSAEG